jgi:hypothetical protein
MKFGAIFFVVLFAMILVVQKAEVDAQIGIGITGDDLKRAGKEVIRSGNKVGKEAGRFGKRVKKWFG